VFVATFTDRASAGPAEFRDLRQARGPDPQIRGCTRRMAHMAPSWCARGSGCCISGWAPRCIGG